MVEDLDAQVRHADLIEIGIAERYPELNRVPILFYGVELVSKIAGGAADLGQERLDFFLHSKIILEFALSHNYNGAMKKLGLVLLLFLLAFSFAYAQEKTGKLIVFSDVPEVDIFVDGVWVAKNKLTLDIVVGKHYVRVAKGDETIQSGIVDIEEGKEKIIVAQPKGKTEFTIRRMLFLFGSYSSLSFDLPATNVEGGVNYSFKNTSLDPFAGIGAEMIFYLPMVDLSTNFGFNFNFSSIAKGTVGIVGTTTEALSTATIGISNVYVNVSKSMLYQKAFELAAGAGANYSFYSGATYVGNPGFQAYLEAQIKEFDNSPLPQPIIVRLGYLQSSGTSTAGSTTRTVVDKGYFLRGGIAYNL
jgi:hypothetical protein